MTKITGLLVAAFCCFSSLALAAPNSGDTPTSHRDACLAANQMCKVACGINVAHPADGGPPSLVDATDPAFCYRKCVSQYNACINTERTRPIINQSIGNPSTLSKQ